MSTTLKNQKGITIMNAKGIANNAIAKAKADWVNSMTEDFYADEKKNPLNIGAIGVGNTIIVAYADNVDEPLIGVAKCNPTDSYDKEVGIAIAYARAIGEDVPDYVLGTYKDENDELDWDDEDYDEDKDEDDNWDDEDDWNDEDDEDNEDELPLFGELSIGTKFTDCNTFYVKVDNNKAFNYDTKKVETFYRAYPIDKIVKD